MVLAHYEGKVLRGGVLIDLSCCVGVYPAPPVIRSRTKSGDGSLSWALHHHMRGPWAIAASAESELGARIVGKGRRISPREQTIADRARRTDSADSDEPMLLSGPRPGNRCPSGRGRYDPPRSSSTSQLEGLEEGRAPDPRMLLRPRKWGFPPPTRARSARRSCRGCRGRALCRLCTERPSSPRPPRLRPRYGRQPSTP